MALDLAGLEAGSAHAQTDILAIYSCVNSLKVWKETALITDM